jgi:hypothetical protein
MVGYGIGIARLFVLHSSKMNSFQCNFTRLKEADRVIGFEPTTPAITAA